MILDRFEEMEALCQKIHELAYEKATPANAGNLMYFAGQIYGTFQRLKSDFNFSAYACSCYVIPNDCPVCDQGGFGSEIKFFCSIQEYADYAWANRNNEKLGFLYSISSRKPVAYIEQDYASHSCTGMRILDAELKVMLETQDDGSGTVSIKRREQYFEEVFSDPEDCLIPLPSGYEFLIKEKRDEE